MTVLHALVVIAIETRTIQEYLADADHRSENLRKKVSSCVKMSAQSFEVGVLVHVMTRFGDRMLELFRRSTYCFLIGGRKTVSVGQSSASTCSSVAWTRRLLGSLPPYSTVLGGS